MAKIFLKKTLGGFAPADAGSLEIAKKFKLNVIYKAEIVKPRSWQHHKLCLALLNLTYDNLPEKYADLWPTFDSFRYAVAEEAGHVQEYTTMQGEIKTRARSISYDSIPDDVEFGRVMAGMMTVCTRILDIDEPELAAEVSRYADSNYGVSA